jgi:hypothetical protein
MSAGNPPNGVPLRELEAMLGQQPQTLLFRLSGLKLDENLFQIAVLETLCRSH